MLDPRIYRGFTNFDLSVPGRLLSAGYFGSTSHNTYVPPTNPDSIDDVDIFIIALPPPRNIIGLYSWEHGRVKQDELDVVIYSLQKFVGLLLKSNPNVLGHLWLRDEDYLTRSPAFDRLIAERDIFSSLRAAKTFAGYAESQLKKMTGGAFQGYMGDKRKQLVETYGYDCYEASETEFLTEHGWKFFDDVHNLCLATINISTGLLEWQHPISRIDRPYTGNLYTLQPYGSRSTITQNHRVLVSPAHRNRKNKFSVRYESHQAVWNLIPWSNVQESTRSIFHIRVAPEPRLQEYDVSDEYLLLAGLFLSDGGYNFRQSTQGKTLRSIRLTQSKPGEFWDIVNRLKQLYPLREYVYPKETVWILHGDVANRLYRDFGSDKCLPPWMYNLSFRQAEIFWCALMSGDGTQKAAGDTYYSSNRRLADDLQAMLLSAGYHSTVLGPYSSDTRYGSCDMFHIFRSMHNKSTRVLYSSRERDNIFTGNRKINGASIVRKEVADVRVVCFEVPNGTLITRSKGKPAIHGNCKNASHLLRLLVMGTEFLDTGKMNVYRTKDAQFFRDVKAGKYTLQEIQDIAESFYHAFRGAEKKSPLPKDPDEKRAEHLLMSIVYDYLLRLSTRVPILFQSA